MGPPKVAHTSKNTGIIGQYLIIQHASTTGALAMSRHGIVLQPPAPQLSRQQTN